MVARVGGCALQRQRIGAGARLLMVAVRFNRANPRNQISTGIAAYYWAVSANAAYRDARHAKVMTRACAAGAAVIDVKTPDGAVDAAAAARRSSSCILGLSPRPCSGAGGDFYQFLEEQIEAAMAASGEIAVLLILGLALAEVCHVCVLNWLSLFHGD